MTAVETDIEVVQGATFTMAVTWTDNATPPNPNSLAGYRAHMQVRRRAASTGTPLLDLASTGSSPSLTLEPNGQTGVVVVRMSALDTATLRKDSYYDLFLVEVADPTNAIRLVAGALNLDLSVTFNPVILM